MQWSLRCCFAPPSVRNLQGRLSPIFIDFLPDNVVNFQHIIVSFSQASSVSVNFGQVYLVKFKRVVQGKNARISLPQEGGAKQRPRSHNIVFFCWGKL